MALMNTCRLIFEGTHVPLKLQKSVVTERALGELSPVRLGRVCLASICGSDLHTLSGRRIEPTPSVLGHEGVLLLDDGHRYTFSIFASDCSSESSCSHCSAIRPPMQQKCQRLFKYGHAKIPAPTALVDSNLVAQFTGVYASHLAIRPGTELCPIPDSIGDELAATINCALATMIAAMRHAPSPWDGYENAVVLGDGLLAMFGAAILRQAYPNVHVFGNTRSFRASLIEKFGFIPHYGGSDTGLSDNVDVVVETAGSKQALENVYKLLRPGATIILCGLVHPDSALPISCEQIIRKNLRLYGVHNYSRQDLVDAVDFLKHNQTRYPFKELVGPTFNLSDFPAAFEAANSKKHYRVFLKP